MSIGNYELRPEEEFVQEDTWSTENDHEHDTDPNNESYFYCKNWDYQVPAIHMRVELH